MSTLKTTNLQHASAASPAIVLDANSRATLNGLSYPTAGSLGSRNRIINGAMDIDARNAGASVTAGSGNTYTLDRWEASSALGSKFSVQQSTTAPAGFTNSLLITSLAATTPGASDQYSIRQKIEGFNVADLGLGAAGAQAVTLSFWVRSSLTGTFGGALQSSGFGRSYPFTYTVSSANTWEQKSVSVPGDTSGTWLTNSGIGIIVNFSVGAGSSVSGTAGSWSSSDFRSATGATSVVGTNGATFYITGVQLEAGSVATPFERRSYGQELALCQRYYWKDTGITVQAIARATVYDGMAQVFFPVPMRATPTATNLSGGSTFARDISGGPSAGPSTGNVTSTWSTHVEYSLQASGGSATGIIGYASGTGTASAEL